MLTFKEVMEAVSADGRTKGVKQAIERAAKRKASKLSETDKILAKANLSISGMGENMTAGGSVGTGDIDTYEMPLGKVRKRKK